jgi:acetyl-CoA C-acetyltransferase
MSNVPAAVIGVGQTHYCAKRDDISMPEMVREAIDRALADAEMAFDDIDAVVIGKEPDAFGGGTTPELFLADAIGAVGKPMLRVHIAGSVGGSTAVVGTSLVQSGVHERVLTVAFEKQSDQSWTLSIPAPLTMPVHAAAGGYFAPHVRSYIRGAGAPPEIGAMVAAKDRHNALLNPYAHVRNAGTTVESVLASPVLWDPVRYDEICPSSDGACAMVIASESAVAVSGIPNPAWIHGTVMRSEPLAFTERDQANPLAGRAAAAYLWRTLGITDPRAEIDCAELYVPFSWFEPMWLENLGFAEEGKGWRLTEAGVTALDGDLPVDMSGGLLSANPIGAGGMIRFAEAALQVMGEAGEHQVDGARRALGHAYGGGSQYFSMWVVGSARPGN